MTFKCTTIDSKTGQPIEGIDITAFDLETGLSWPRSSDGGGYSDLALIDAHGWVKTGDDILIRASKAGYASYNGMFKVTTGDQTVSIQLVPFDQAAPLPEIPTRDWVCGVKLHFQGVTYHLSTGATRSAILWALPEEDRHDVMVTHLGLGDHHMVCAVAGKYYDFAGSYNYADDLPTLKARLRELIVAGFVPLFSFSMDGQQWNPDGWTFGWDWGMTQGNMARIIAYLQQDEDLTPYILFFHGFELVTPPGGNWTPDQFEAACLEFRRLLPNGHLAAEIGTYAWWGEGSGSQGAGPIAVWNDPAGMAIDVALGEWNNPVPPTDPGWRDRRNGMEQIATAWLGPAANHDALLFPNANTRPWYWPNPTPRGPRYAVAFEMSLAAWVRNQIDLAGVEQDRADFRALGYPYVC